MAILPRCNKCKKEPSVEGGSWCAGCRAKARERRNRSEESKQKAKDAREKWRRSHRPYDAQKSKNYRQRLKKQVIEAYGGKCACCGETSIEFLTLDHIDNNGAAHRRELFPHIAAKLGHGLGGWSFYVKVRKLGFPPGLQVLCWNCNSAKQYYGRCPHQTVGGEL